MNNAALGECIDESSLNGPKARGLRQNGIKLAEDEKKCMKNGGLNSALSGTSLASGVRCLRVGEFMKASLLNLLYF